MKGKYVDLRTDASQPCLAGPWHRFQFLSAHFEPEGMLYKVCIAQPLECPLQHSTSSDTGTGVEVSVQTPLAFVTTRQNPQCRDSSNLCPQFHDSIVVVSSDKHAFFFLFVTCASSLDSLRAAYLSRFCPTRQ
jgi:hypothetical protein